MRYLLLLLLASTARAAPLVGTQDVQPSIAFTSATVGGAVLTAGPGGAAFAGAVQSTSTVASNLPFTSSGTIPTAISCTAGTGVLLANANKQSGTFTAGTLATACTVTFSTPWNTLPNFCSCNTGTTLYADATCSKTAITCTAASALTGDTISYFVWGPP